MPRALHRARLWTAGLLTASTLLVGAVGVHLAEAQAQTVATRTASQASSTGSTGSSSSEEGSSSGSGSSDFGSSSGFAAVAPLGGSAGFPQSSSGGS
jgi:hypothetical protein